MPTRIGHYLNHTFFIDISVLIVLVSLFAVSYNNFKPKQVPTDTYYLIGKKVNMVVYSDSGNKLMSDKGILNYMNSHQVNSKRYYYEITLNKSYYFENELVLVYDKLPKKGNNQLVIMSKNNIIKKIPYKTIKVMPSKLNHQITNFKLNNSYLVMSNGEYYLKEGVNSGQYIK